MGQIPPQTNIPKLLPSSHMDCSAARNQESWLIRVRELDTDRPAEARNVHLTHECRESLGLFLPQSILKAQDSSPLLGLSWKVAGKTALSCHRKPLSPHQITFGYSEKEGSSRY